MKTARASAKSHWRGVGRNAKAQGIPLERVLTKNETVNSWIREGYGDADQ